MKYACLACGRSTSNRNKRCDRHQPVERQRGRAWQAVRLSVFERDAGICQLCGQPVLPGQRWTVDHRRARARGGSNEMANLQLAHERPADCPAGGNLGKGARD